MKIKSNERVLDFAPVSYQFPELTKLHKDYNEWDANWVTVRFSYSDGKGVQGDETDSCVLTFETARFIKALKGLLQGETDRASLDTEEPYFKMTAAKEGDAYTVAAGYQRSVAQNDLALFEVRAAYDEKELARMVEELEEEWKRFPKR